MIDFAQAQLEKLVIHKIGNKSQEEGVTLSKSEIVIDDASTADLLFTFFSQPFKSDEIYTFDTEKHISDESVFSYTNTIFEDNTHLFIESANIAKKLYDISTHPNIKSGELYVAYFSNCIVEGEVTDAVGIFKSENKDSFIKVYVQNEIFNVDHESGINIKKLDKGCLIFNHNPETGHVLKIVDNTNKSNEAHYWIEDFIQAAVMKNEYFNTTQFVQLCKNFSDQVLTEDNNVEKQEQLGFMSKSYDYLKQNDVLDVEQFQEDVIGNPEVIQHFNEFKETYEEDNNIESQSQFEVSPDALKKAKKYVRSVIKLDKNFHVYVHSRPEYIEKGFDEGRNMQFYKLYYENES
ncbi:MAG: nucleoid-associated protein [Bacteroidales bacterium]